VSNVNFDQYSFIINDKREVIRAAAVHYFRLPGEKAWHDRLCKLKMAGYNAIDMYLNWGYHCNAPGSYDFTGMKDIRKLIKIAEELNLYVIARPGPYINAEVSGGGFPGWLLGQRDLILRNRKDNDFVYSEKYMKAIREWYEQVIPIINDCTNIITVQIENEYHTNELEEDYMIELRDIVRSLGCKLPLMHNDMYASGLYADIVDIYAIDNYSVTYFDQPWQSFPEVFALLDMLEESVREFSPASPLFIAELQAGWFDKWGGMGYDNMREALGRAHIDIVTKTSLSQGVTAFTHYMGCGGTNWDHLGSTEVYTSYDFAAPLTEAGVPTERFYQARSINNFLMSFDLTKTELSKNQPEIKTDNSDTILTYRSRTSLRDGSRWLFVRNDCTGKVSATINGEYSFEIDPQEMLILPSDLKINEIFVSYSTIPYRVRLKDKYNQVILPRTDLSGEMRFEAPDSASIKIDEHGIEQLSLEKENDNYYKLFFKNSPALQKPVRVKIESEKHKTYFIFLPQSMLDFVNIYNNNAIVGPDYITIDNNLKSLATREKKELLCINITGNIERTYVEKPEQLEPVKLNNWQLFRIAPEIEKETEGWKEVSNNYLDAAYNGLYGSFYWYQTSWEGKIDQLTIGARHCYAVYLNGKEIFARDCFEFVSGKDETPPDTFDVPADLQLENNRLVLLIQSMGYNKGFEDDAANPRGLISYHTNPEKGLKWYIKDALNNDTIVDHNIAKINEDTGNKNVICATSEFIFTVPDEHHMPLGLVFDNPPFNKASIFLNDTLIGQFWRDKGPQNKFYLPEMFYHQNGNKNSIKLIIWYRSIDNVKNYTGLMNNVNIYIEPYEVYRLTELEE
jgi:hypothetical protein